MPEITVYGAEWCALTRRTLNHLRELGVAFKYIDVEEDPDASAWVKRQNGGKELKPTIDVGGEVIAEPTNAELDDLLSRAGV